MNNPVTLKGKGCEISIVEASRSNQTGKAIITFLCTYWRAVHAEHLRHRAFSFSVQSTRAIPTTKLIERVRTNPAGPIHWGANEKGMQAHQECDAKVVHPRTGELLNREDAWAVMAAEAADWAEAWTDAGYHKQITGRIVDNFCNVTTLVTATEYDNFYALRAHADAQPEIQDVAYTMLAAVKDVPMREVVNTKVTDPRAWHLPFVKFEERTNYQIADLLAMSAARCARTSYLTHSKENPSFNEDDTLYRRLVESKPLHASPLEHQAFNSGENRASRNYTGGWVQHRSLLEVAGSIESFRAVIQ